MFLFETKCIQHIQNFMCMKYSCILPSNFYDKLKHIACKLTNFQGSYELCHCKQGYWLQSHHVKCFDDDATWHHVNLGSNYKSK